LSNYITFEPSDLVQDFVAESKMAQFLPFFSYAAPAARLQKGKTEENALIFAIGRKS
jgi:hypothetical protein